VLEAVAWREPAQDEDTIRLAGNGAALGQLLH
jgi:hypothetical protein